MLASLVVGALAFNAKNTPQLMKLRGGAIDAAQAQNILGYVTLAQATIGHAFTKESMEMYEFKDEISGPTLAFSKFNYAMQIAQAVCLLMPEYGITALAVAIFASSGEFTTALKGPRAPMIAWAAMLLGLQHFKDAVPAWVLPSLLIASGVHGTVCFDQAMDMYKIGTVGVGPKDKPFVLSDQSKTMAKFVNGGFIALGAFLLLPKLGYSSAQAFAAYGLVYAAMILKMILVDGGKDLFNAAGGYVWAALFGGAGAAALMN
jgi:hypothetical protein